MRQIQWRLATTDTIVLVAHVATSTMTTSAFTFPASRGTLVGVCPTVVGPLHVVDRLRPVGTIAGDLLSIDAVAFLGACGVSYAAPRTPDLRITFTLL